MQIGMTAHAGVVSKGACPEPVGGGRGASLPAGVDAEFEAVVGVGTGGAVAAGLEGKVEPGAQPEADAGAHVALAALRQTDPGVGRGGSMAGERGEPVAQFQARLVAAVRRARRTGRPRDVRPRPCGVGRRPDRGRARAGGPGLRAEASHAAVRTRPRALQLASQLVTHGLLRDAGFVLPPDAEAGTG